MKKKVIYCDAGGFLPILKGIETIELIYFPYDKGINKKINKIARPTKITWDDLKMSWNHADFTWDDCEKSDKYNFILEIIGKNNVKDAKHLDSAYKSQCGYFLTSDNRHIISNKEQLEELLNFKILNPHKQVEELENYLEVKLIK